MPRLALHGNDHRPKGISKDGVLDPLDPGGPDPLTWWPFGAGATSLPFHFVSLGTSSDKDVAVDEPAVLVGYYLSNRHPSLIRYLKLWDKATTPSPGSDSAILKLNLGLPPLAGATVALDSPLPFEDGIAFGIRAGVALTDDSNVAADDVVINLLYRLGTA